MKLNELGHREQHGLFAAMLRFDPSGPPTGEDYQRTRKAVAWHRREEQRKARIARGTDRATLRAQAYRPRTGRIRRRIARALATVR